MPVIPALGRLKKEDHEFKTSVAYTSLETLASR
jgi:hypothetical protein